MARWPSKAHRELANAVEAAGGTATLTRHNHLRVEGPAGVRIVPSPGSIGRHCGRNAANARAQIRASTGLDLRAASRGKGGR